LAVNWLLGGTDAHAKNYSVLLSQASVRLAPLYDIASVLPYQQQMYLPKLKMAMKVGGEYRLAFVQARHWQRLAISLGLGADLVLARVDELAKQLPEQLAVAASSPAVRALDTELPDRLVDAVTSWAGSCRAALR
jgi:serine/threonine-protein kinase HipA